MNRRLFLVGLALAVPLLGQSPTAGLVGIVRDTAGAVVPGAAIKVRNTETNSLREVATDQTGGFAVPGLAPGIYDVSAERSGFQTVRETGLELQVNQTARLELQLRVGAIAETVEVKAQVTLINTENATRGDVIVSDELLQMPLDGRNFQDLALLVPGVVPNAQGDFSGPSAINGARADATNFYVDGFSNRDPSFGGAMANPNLDAMQEFKLETANFSAEYGRQAGGVLSVVFKSGTNHIHGSLFEFLRNDKLDARNFFAGGKDELRRNQFGATLSGPILRDRSFFMFSWESFRQVQGTIQLSRVPTDLERAGDFSLTRDTTGALVTVRDPFANNAVFPGNRIPASRFNSISVKMIPYWPLPNRPTQANNFYASAVAASPWDGFLWKFDHRLTSKDDLAFRYHRRTIGGSSPFPGSPLGNFPEKSDSAEHVFGLNHTHLFTPTLINEFRIGLSRAVNHTIGLDAGHDYGTEFGIVGLATDPHLTGFPRVSVRDLANLGVQPDRPIDTVANLYQVSDSLTWVRGRHQVKAGGDILRSQSFRPYDNNARGTFNFLGNWTGQPFGDFLLGMLDSASHQSSTPQNYLYSTDTGAFVQDDFKVSSRLTLNLGLRWEVLGPQVDKYDRLSGFVREVGRLILSNDTGIANVQALAASVGLTNFVGVARDYGLPRALTYTRYLNLAPRFGFAWRPLGGARLVVRGGYGIFNSKGVVNPLTQAMSNVFPWAINQNVNRVANNPAAISFADPFHNATGAALGNIGGVDLHAATPYMQSWNLTLERELKWLGAAEMAYSGSKGTHLGYSSDINRNYYSLDTRLPDGTFPRPYPQINNTISYVSFGANSSYNAGTLTLRRRFANGFFYRANYVYSKSIDDGSALQFGGGGTQRQIQDPRDLAAERGRSNFDRGHSFTMDFSYRVPWRGSGALGRVFSGWQMAGSGRASTGPPFTPFNSNVNLALGGAVRPDRLANGAVPNPTPDRWFNTLVFPVVPNGSFRFGNSGRNILDGPGYTAINAALYKNMPLKERAHLQFRWEVFNALNHANFSLPNSSVAAITGGAIISAGAARTIQFGLRLEY